MKKFILILTGLCLLITEVVIPYSDFNDTRAVRLLYHSLQQEDEDMNLVEFIGEKLLGIGEWFAPEEANRQQQAPAHSSLPGNLQIQAGALYCTSTHLYAELPKSAPVQHNCIFKDNKFNRELPTAIFHPPSMA